MEKQIGFLVFSVALALLSGCSPEVPKCSDPETLALVRQILVKQLPDGHQAKTISAKELESKLLIDLPRATAMDEKIKRYSCEGKLIAPTMDGNRRYEVPITYESQLDDKDQHLVYVNGLRVADFMGIAQALDENINASKPKLAPAQPATVSSEGSYSNGRVTITLDVGPRGGAEITSTVCAGTVFSPRYDDQTQTLTDDNREFAIGFGPNYTHMDVESSNKCLPEGRYKKVM